MILQREGFYSLFYNIWLTKWVPIANADGIQYHEKNMDVVDDLPEG